MKYWAAEDLEKSFALASVLKFMSFYTKGEGVMLYSKSSLIIDSFLETDFKQNDITKPVLL